MLLSRLQHQHVVRYFQSWIEEGTPTSVSGGSSEDESGDGSGSGYVPNIERYSSDDEDDEDEEDYDDEDDHILFDSHSHSHSHGGSVLFDDSLSNDANTPSVLSHHGQSEESGNAHSSGVLPRRDSTFCGESRESFPNITIASSAKQSVPQMLYIQMEYCAGNTQAGSTLRTLIVEKKLDSNEEIWRLFRQILEGLEYIHGTCTALSLCAHHVAEVCAVRYGLTKSRKSLAKCCKVLGVY